MGQYGAVIGGVVGAVVGFFAGGNVYAGWMIGSALGGAYSASQQVIPGPKIGDVQRQTAQEGGFRPIVFGRSYPIAGNVIADGGPRIVRRRESQGKGGPKVESESAYRTYAVGVCEGEANLLQAWRNGILVYDGEDPSMTAENNKFLEYATWYPGAFTQPASPDLEEIYGAGQAPFFRGTAYLSIHNEDVTDQRGAWSQWQFRVARFGDAERGTWWAVRLNENTDARPLWRSNTPLAFGAPEDRGPPSVALQSSVATTVFVRAGNGNFVIYGAVPSIEVYDGAGTPLPAPTVVTITSRNVVIKRIASYGNILVALINGRGYYYTSSDYGYTWVEHQTQIISGEPAFISDIARLDNGTWVAYFHFGPASFFAYSYSSLPVGWVQATSESSSVATVLGAIGVSGNRAYAVTPAGNVFNTSEGTEWYVSEGGVVDVNYGAIVASSGGVVIFADTNSTNIARNSGGLWSTINVGQTSRCISAGNGYFVLSGDSSSGTIKVSTDHGSTWQNSSMPSNDPTWYVGYTRATYEYRDQYYPLAQIIQELADRCRAGGHIDVTQLSYYQCRGLTIGNAYSAAGSLQTLSSIFFFDPSSSGGRVKFTPRGGNAVEYISESDMIDDGQPVEDGSLRRGDPVNTPRVLHLNYHDIQGGLNTDKQRSERPEGTRADGEQSLQTPVVLSADEAASVVARTHGLMVEQQKGELNFTLPDKWLRLCESDPVFIQLEGKTVRAMISRVEIDDGEQRYKAMRDRQSLYTTNVQGIPAAPVTPPPSSVAGPTILQFIDIPILRDSHDQLGFYLAASGILPAWPGASIELSLDGGETYIETGRATVSSVIGELVTQLGGHPQAFPDAFNSVQVRIITSDALLENTDLAGMMNRRNLALIGDEIVNFAYADEVEPGDWELSNLLRGRKGTRTEAHGPGSRFVMLDTAVFVPAELTWLNRTLTFRATTFGRPISEATIVSATFIGRSQMERQPAYLQAHRSGADAVLSWQGVGRLGGGANVAMGAHFIGYRVTLTDGVTTESFDITSNSARQPLAAFTGPVTASVQQRNAFTGLGPPIEVTF